MQESVTTLPANEGRAKSPDRVSDVPIQQGTQTALGELVLARRELAALPAHFVVCDADAPHATSAWSEAVAGGAPDASSCFFTDEGRDLFDVLLAALMRLRTAGESLRIVETVTAG